MTGPGQGYNQQGHGTPPSQPGNPYGGNPYGGAPYGGNPYQSGYHGGPPPKNRRGRRVALTVILAVVGLCLLVCVGGAVYFFTQIGPSIRDDVSELTATEVTRQLDALGPPDAGTYVISAQDLTAALSGRLAGQSHNIQGAEVDITPAGLTVTVDLGAQTVGVRSGVAAEDGQLRLVDPQTDAGFLGNVIPDDWIAGGLEDGLNAWFRENGLVVSGVELVDGEARITTTDAT